MSEMVAVTSAFNLSWNSVLVASPQTIMLDPRSPDYLALKAINNLFDIFIFIFF